MNVHILDTFTENAIQELRARLSIGVSITAEPEVIDASTVHILVGVPERRHLIASPGLRAVILPFTGVPKELRTLMLEFSHVPLHNTHWTAVPTAEGALTLLLTAAKFVLPADRGLRDGNWEMRYRPSPSVLLEGKTVLVLGYGRIGQNVARMCHALGMKILAVRRAPARLGHDGIPAKIFAVGELHVALSQASVLVVTLPLTAETRGLIGATELALLQRPAILVNVGRGPVIDEAALYHALRDGIVHAAGIDVWYNYPRDEASRGKTLPSRYPFHDLQNVVMSPHRIDLLDDIDQRMAAELADILNAAARGEPIPNRVDVQAGY